jgi:hypothetical protein
MSYFPAGGPRFARLDHVFADDRGVTTVRFPAASSLLPPDEEHTPWPAFVRDAALAARLAAIPVIARHKVARCFAAWRRTVVDDCRRRRRAALETALFPPPVQRALAVVHGYCVTAKTTGDGDGDGAVDPAAQWRAARLQATLQACAVAGTTDDSATVLRAVVCDDNSSSSSSNGGSGVPLPLSQTSARLFPLSAIATPTIFVDAHAVGVSLENLAAGHTHHVAGAARGTLTGLRTHAVQLLAAAAAECFQSLAAAREEEALLLARAQQRKADASFATDGQFKHLRVVRRAAADATAAAAAASQVRSSQVNLISTEVVFF